MIPLRERILGVLLACAIGTGLALCLFYWL